jgi:DNA (cytosine-5)-methyltransferase 1
MSAYYNENDPFAAQWLENLVVGDQVAPGRVDQRSVLEVQADHLLFVTQAHFFAGIGVWSYALRQAGWPDDLPVWTGSCPCQPFSAAGRKKGFQDDRHLWPVWSKLIQQRNPPIVFGEQVSSPDGLAWFDAVQADLENAGYAVAALDTCAAGVGAPHLRQRLYFVAVARDERRERIGLHLRKRAKVGVVGDAECTRLEGRTGKPNYDGAQLTPLERTGTPARVNGFWANAEWVPCQDGRLRPVEPGLEPLASRTPAHVGLLRAYGNALCAPQAIAFIRAVMEALQE